MAHDPLPSVAKLALSVLRAIEARDGPSTNREIEAFVIEDMKITPDQAKQPHGASGRTELAYRIAWARTKLRGEHKIVSRGKQIWARAKR